MKPRSFSIFFSSLIVAVAVGNLYGQGVAISSNPSQPPNGEVGLRYVYSNAGSGVQFTGNGGVGSFTWALASGTLPPGLSLSGSGVLGGSNQQPTTAGSYTFAVRATQSCDCSIAPTGTAQYTVQIFTPLAVASTALPAATVGQSYRFQFVGQGGNPTQYSWYPPECSTNCFPPGLNLDNNSGVLSGSATTAGTYTVYITLYDSDIGNYVYAQFPLVVAPPVPASTGLTLSGPLNLGTLLLGKPLSGALSAGGGTPPYTFAITGLPAGMTSSGSGISGTPTVPGSYSVGVKVTDSNGFTAASGISFSVFGFSTAALPPAITSSPYSFTVSAAGGAPAYTFTAGGIPPKFSFTRAGWLNGTPGAAGTYTIAITVTDSNGLSTTTSFPFSVNGPAPLKVPGGTLPDTTVLTSSSQALTANGGTPPYSWSLVGGSFPDGFTLGSTGNISGAPGKPGSYTFSARATDGAGASGVGVFTIAVKPQPVIVTTPSPLSSGMVTVDFPEQELTASGGSAPYTFKVTANALPPGLTVDPDGALTGTPTAAGDYTFTVTATDSNSQTGSASMSIKVRPYAPDLLLSVGSLSFSMAAGSTVASDIETVQVESTDVTRLLRYSVAVASGPSWLSVSSSGGSTPGSFSVSLASAALSLAASPTPYQASIAVTCVSPSQCAGSSQSVNVSLTVNAVPPQLSVLSSLLSFTTPPGNPQASTQALGIRNVGGGSIGFALVTCNATWCKVGLVPSSLAGGASGEIQIAADPGGLNPGFYYATVTMVSSVGTNIVPVNFFIAANSTMALEPGGALLTMQRGGQVAVPNPSFLVSVSGTTAVPWTAAVLPGAPWLTLGTTNGNSTGTAPGTVSYSVDEVAVSALNPGTYYATVRITAPGTVDSPADFQIVLNVLAVNKTKPDPNPAGLLFLTQASGTPPQPQIDRVFASSAAPVNFQAFATTVDGNSWLSVTPATGTTVATAPAQTSVSVSPAGLAVGVYHGTVSYSLAAAGVRTVNVTLVVEPPGTTPSDRIGDFSAKAVAACTPSQLIPTQTGLVSNFAAPASWPTPLQITLVNDCGGAVGTGQVVATFSNGDPPLLMTVSNAGAGQYTGTWTPRHSAAQVAVTAKATVAGLPAASVQIAGSVVPNIAPTLAPDGTLHVFTPQVGAALAPGTIVQIYGTQLASQTVAGTTIPLATTLSGTSVVIGGVQAPLFFVSSGQVNAQVPFELTPGQPYQVIVNNNGALSTPNSILIGSVTPGVAALASGAANAQHVADGSSITETSPAKPGEYIVLYLAGMGPTTVPVASGAASPLSPLASTQVTPTATLNSEQMSVLFSGLTPGLAGLYQVDLQIPADAPDGDLTLIVSQSGYQGSSVILPVHH